MQSESIDENNMLTRVKAWLEAAVIGLNLCPFAKQVWQRQSIRYAISRAVDDETLLVDLQLECQTLDDDDSIETSLLIIPHHLSRFDDFNQFLALADDLLSSFGWCGRFQIASFHPQYQFADTEIDDRENWTNRAPLPILHVLREQSLARVIADHGEVEQIPLDNIETLNHLDEATFKRIFDPKLPAND